MNRAAVDRGLRRDVASRACASVVVLLLGCSRPRAPSPVAPESGTPGEAQLGGSGAPEATASYVSEEFGLQGACQKGEPCESSAAAFPRLEIDGRELCFVFQEAARLACAEQLGIVQNPDLPEGPCRSAVPCGQTGPLFEPYIEVKGRMICFLDGDALCACGEELGVSEGSRSCNGSY